jgi:hypothetical protein
MNDITAEDNQPIALPASLDAALYVENPVSNEYEVNWGMVMDLLVSSRLGSAADAEFAGIPEATVEAPKVDETELQALIQTAEEVEEESTLKALLTVARRLEQLNNQKKFTAAEPMPEPERVPPWKASVHWLFSVNGITTVSLVVVIAAIYFSLGAGMAADSRSPGVTVAAHVSELNPQTEGFVKNTISNAAASKENYTRDGSIIAVMQDAFGNISRQRSFPNDPAIASMLLRTNADGTKAGFIYGRGGEVKPMSAGIIEKFDTVSAQFVAQTEGISAPSQPINPKPTPQAGVQKTPPDPRAVQVLPQTNLATTDSATSKKVLPSDNGNTNELPGNTAASPVPTGEGEKPQVNEMKQ